MTMTLGQLLSHYVRSKPHALAAGTVETMGWNLARYERHLRRPATIEDLEQDEVELCLRSLAADGLSPATVAGTRRAIVTLWTFAFSERIIDRPPRVRQPRQRRIPPSAWTPEEVAQLVDACDRIAGTFRTLGISRRDWLRSLILALYSTGIRLGDALDLSWRQVAPGGIVTLTCSKTGRPVTRALSPEALDAMRALNTHDRPRIWPLWGRRESVYALFRHAVRLAGIRPGTSKWLRRAAGTQIARLHGLDAAREFLDHRSAETTADHYVDPTQIPQRVTVPSLAALLSGTTGTASTAPNAGTARLG